VKIGAPKEVVAGESRVAMTPESAGRLQKLGYTCVIETGAGLGAQFSDQDYESAGVEVVKTSAALWQAADVVIKVRPPEAQEVKLVRDGQTVISAIYPAQNEKLGAGVAGLAAIGTSVSLGAITYAFDVRPEVAEQIESMGAEFVFLDFEETAQDGAATGGYAAPSSPEFREKQLEKFRELAPEIDIVITTALIPGRDAPKLWTKDMVELMKSGSVVVDLAAERGGNCDLTVMDQKIVTDNGVTIVGYTDFPSRMASQSSTLFSTNIRHMMDDLTPENDGVMVIEASCSTLSFLRSLALWAFRSFGTCPTRSTRL